MSAGNEENCLLRTIDYENCVLKEEAPFVFGFTITVIMLKLCTSAETLN